MLPSIGFAADLPNLIRAVFPEDPNRFVAIAICESSLEQNKDGKVVENPVTKDYGLFQIHYTWIPTAESMGLNIEGSVYDNIEFARYLYDTYGIKPWSSSANCQSKHMS